DFHVDHEQDTEPDRIEAQRGHNGNEDRQGDHHDTDRIQYHAQQEHDQHHKDDDATRTAWNVGHQPFDQRLSAHALIGGAEGVGSKQNPGDHAGQFEGTD